MQVLRVSVCRVYLIILDDKRLIKVQLGTMCLIGNADHILTVGKQ